VQPIPYETATYGSLTTAAGLKEVRIGPLPLKYI
jgi:hypothetical protein